MTAESVEKFHPTNGRAIGVLGLAVLLVLIVIGVVEGYPVWAIGLLAVLGVLTWASLLRPAVGIAGDELVLRNMFVTLGIPLAAIEEVAVGRLLAVRVGDRRFVSPAISRTLRQNLRSGRSPLGDGASDGRDLVAMAAASYPDFVEQRIRLAATAHRDRLGIKGWSADQEALAGDVRREVARTELAVLGVTVLVLLVGVALAL